MPWAQPVNPYVDVDPRESFVTIRQCAEMLNLSEDDVIELARRGTLRSRGRLVQAGIDPGLHRLIDMAAPVESARPRLAPRVLPAPPSGDRPQSLLVQLGPVPLLVTEERASRI